MRGEDLTGKTYGRLTVIRKVPKKIGDRVTKWLCQCECGNTSTPTQFNLVNGLVVSCGCYKKAMQQLARVPVSEYEKKRYMRNFCLHS